MGEERTKDNKSAVGKYPDRELNGTTIIGPLPFGFRRKIVALLAGSFIVTAFVMFKLWIQILYNCYSTEWLKLQPTSLTTLKVVNYIYTNFINNPGPSLYFSVLIWLLVSFQINDLDDFKKQ